MTPIIGVRYECGQCQNLNFCEFCQLTHPHEHPLNKVKEASVTPGMGGETYHQGMPQEMEQKTANLTLSKGKKGDTHAFKKGP